MHALHIDLSFIKHPKEENQMTMFKSLQKWCGKRKERIVLERNCRICISVKSTRVHTPVLHKCSEHQY